MCLGIPGKVIEVWGEELARTGRVDFGGNTKEISLAYVPEAQLGDYVIVHVGFALNRLDPDEAAATLATLRELALVDADIRARELG